MDSLAYLEAGNFGYREDDRLLRDEPFQWQLSHGRYADLNDEFHQDIAREFERNSVQSTQTTFEEDFQDPEHRSFRTLYSAHHDSRDYSPAPRSLAGVDEYDPPPQRTQEGYMHRRSPFDMDDATAINEMSFMQWYPAGDAILTYPAANGENATIKDISLFMIEARCPLLAMAFEKRRAGSCLHLETLCERTAYPFLRFLYTGTYALTSADGDYYEDVPTSVLLHCQLYRLGDMYALADLKSQAYVNVLRQCEFGCSSPDKPIDLCSAIRYVYEELKDHELLIDAIINYCVSCFLRHGLGNDAEFKALAYDLRPFHQALCKNSMGREFENESKSKMFSQFISSR